MQVSNTRWEQCPAANGGRVNCYIRSAATGTVRQGRRSPVHADRIRAWMAVNEVTRWCTGRAATSRNCRAERAVLVDREAAPPIGTLYRARKQ
jgi:hypothetical protein